MLNISNFSNLLQVEIIFLWCLYLNTLHSVLFSHPIGQLFGLL